MSRYRPLQNLLPGVSVYPTHTRHTETSDSDNGRSVRQRRVASKIARNAKSNLAIENALQAKKRSKQTTSVSKSSLVKTTPTSLERSYAVMRKLMAQNQAIHGNSNAQSCEPEDADEDFEQEVEMESSENC